MSEYSDIASCPAAPFSWVWINPSTSPRAQCKLVSVISTVVSWKLTGSGLRVLTILAYMNPLTGLEIYIYIYMYIYIYIYMMNDDDWFECYNRRYLCGMVSYLPKSMQNSGFIPQTSIVSLIRYCCATFIGYLSVFPRSFVSWMFVRVCMFREAISGVGISIWHCIGMWCQRRARCLLTKLWCRGTGCRRLIDEEWLLFDLLYL